MIGVCSTCRHADISDTPRTIRTGNVTIHQAGKRNINCTCDVPKGIGFSNGGDVLHGVGGARWEV